MIPVEADAVSLFVRRHPVEYAIPSTVQSRQAVQLRQQAAIRASLERG